MCIRDRGLCGVRAGFPVDEVVPPDVAAVGHRDIVTRALQDDHSLDTRGAGDGAIHVGLELDNLAAAPTAVRGEDDTSLAVVDPVLDRLA